MSLIKIKQIDGLQAALDLLNTHMESGSLKSTYTQVGHGFAAGSCIAYVGSSWVLADSSTANKLGRLIIESIIDEDNFVAVQVGTIEVQSWPKLGSLVAGEFYVVDNSGNGTLEDYVNTGDPGFAYSNPVLQALTTTKGHVLPWRPSQSPTDLIQPEEFTQTANSAATSGNYSTTGITLTYTPFQDSTVQVFLNGIALEESYNDRSGDVYFSRDGGVTAVAAGDLDAGDTLYWNGTDAGYELAATDTFEIVYDKSNLD
jgi:hypothetical protein